MKAVLFSARFWIIVNFMYLYEKGPPTTIVLVFSIYILPAKACKSFDGYTKSPFFPSLRIQNLSGFDRFLILSICQHHPFKTDQMIYQSRNQISTGWQFTES